MKPVCPACANSETSYFHKKNFYTYYRCKECKLVFLYPVPSVKKINALYDKYYEFKVSAIGKMRFTKQASDIFKRIRMINPYAKTLLDIGCGPGTFVKLAQDAGFRAVGIEPARNLYHQSRKLRVDTIHSGFEKYLKKHPRQKFDVIAMIHMVEHLRNPDRALRLIATHLNKNGVLYIETPNIDSHLFNVEQQEYTFLTPPEHINLFSKQSLELIMRDTGCEIAIKTMTYSYPEHLMGILRRIKRGEIGKHSTITMGAPKRQVSSMSVTPPIIDSQIAPKLTALLNIGNKGSILQMYVKRK